LLIEYHLWSEPRYYNSLFTDSLLESHTGIYNEC